MPIDITIDVYDQAYINNLVSTINQSIAALNTRLQAVEAPSYVGGQLNNYLSISANRWTIVTANHQAAAGQKLLVSSDALLSVTLPPNPTPGDWVEIQTTSGNQASNILRNGSRINSILNDGVMRPRQFRRFIWADQARGWLVEPSVVNFAFGKTVLAYGWNTTPANLQNAVDGNLATSTGFGIASTQNVKCSVVVDLGVQYSGYFLATISITESTSSFQVGIDQENASGVTTEAYREELVNYNGTKLVGANVTGRFAFIWVRNVAASGNVQMAVQELEFT